MTQYADEEEPARDRCPRRLLGSVPKHHRWWVAGLSCLDKPLGAAFRYEPGRQGAGSLTSARSGEAD
eukprot:4909393-Pyramimonas_sp.AAC.1